MRNGGRRVVTVQHVSISGGQAIVAGAVSATGGAFAGQRGNTTKEFQALHRRIACQFVRSKSLAVRGRADAGWEVARKGEARGC
jgi:hypothetical protein